MRDIPVYEGWLIHGKSCYKEKIMMSLRLDTKCCKEASVFREKRGRKVKTAEECSLERVGKQLGNSISLTSLMCLAFFFLITRVGILDFTLMYNG